MKGERRKEFPYLSNLLSSQLPLKCKQMIFKNNWPALVVLLWKGWKELLMPPLWKWIFPRIYLLWSLYKYRFYFPCFIVYVWPSFKKKWEWENYLSLNSRSCSILARYHDSYLLYGINNLLFLKCENAETIAWLSPKPFFLLV